MTNCDSIFNLLLIFETIHPFSINFASDRKELRANLEEMMPMDIESLLHKMGEN